MRTHVSKLSVFTTPAGELKVLRAYDRVLQHWNVPYSAQEVPTAFGQTHVIVSGPPDAPPIVFLHPLLATATIWRPNVEELSRHFRTYAIDVVGEPNRSIPSRPMTKSSDITQWFTEVLDGLDIAEAHLVGASFGGFLSAGLAMEMPDHIRRLVLIDPAATFHAIVPFYFHLFIPKLLSLLFPQVPLTRKLIRRGMNWLRNGLPADSLWEDLFFATMVYGSMTNLIFPRVYARRRLATISMPTLLLLGEKERLYRPNTVFRRATKWVPDIQTRIIPNAYHFAALSQPGIVNRNLQEFLGDPDPTPDEVVTPPSKAGNSPSAAP